jgi:hypothetical protein
MVQLLVVYVLVAIVGVLAIMFAEDLMIKIIAAVTIAAVLLILASPIALAYVMVWIPSIIHLLQAVQIAIIFVGVGLCLHRHSRITYSY